MARYNPTINHFFTYQFGRFGGSVGLALDLEMLITMGDGENSK
jgi:hypothetical protein